MKSKFLTGRLSTLPVISSWPIWVSTVANFALISDCLAAGNLMVATSQLALLSHRLIGYANLLLLISSVLYLAHFCLKARVLGRWATALAALGALGLVAGLLVHTAKSYGLQPNPPDFFTSLSEVMTLFCAFTVILYLVMEKVYRTRSAGAFVMPIVAAAVLFEMMGATDYTRITRAIRLICLEIFSWTG